MISAQRVVPAPPERVFARLADLHSHWQLADHWTHVVALDGDGGVLALHGPFGLRRTAHVRVLESRAPELLLGEARIGRSTLGQVRWDVAADDGGSRVTLSAEVIHAEPVDRVLLALGGNRWLQRRLGTTLTRVVVMMDA